uniref:Uncharacterized protein n=1 Tax=Anguilla anguilla TaxID=7936 RepID=A0A0E9WGT4_ANGAN
MGLCIRIRFGVSLLSFPDLMVCIVVVHAYMPTLPIYTAPCAGIGKTA